MESKELLDYCNRCTSLFLIIGNGHSEKYSPCNSIQRSCVSSNFAFFRLDAVDAFFRLKVEEPSIEKYDFLVFVRDEGFEGISFDEITQMGYIVFTVSSTSIDSRGMYPFSLSYITLQEHIQAWGAFLCVKEPEMLPSPLRGNDGEDTFTWITLKKRIPAIIHQTVRSIPNISSEGEALYDQLADAISGNHRIRFFMPLSSNLSDLSLYNLLLFARVHKAINREETWFSIPWWLVENYQFNCMNCIQDQVHSEKDPFDWLKRDAVAMGLSILPPLVSRLIDAIESSKTEGLTYEVFQLLLLRNLWGNKGDLSMSSGTIVPSSAIGVINKEEVCGEEHNCLLVNDMDSAWAYWCSKPMNHLAIVADNTGLEILCDLTLIAALHVFYPDLEIQYIVKTNAVFVSDVMRKDFDYVLGQLKSQSNSYLQWIYRHVLDAITRDKLRVFPHTFFVTAYSGWEMPLSVAKLIKQMDLVIFKGDANYRRLVGDLHWPYETRMEDVLSYVPSHMLLLRTLKSNVNVGISKDLQLAAAKRDCNWDCSGKLGIIQFM